MELKAASIQEKVQWFNALTSAREATPRTAADERRKSSILTKADEPPIPTPYFREETVLDEKLNQIWREQARMDEVTRQL